MEVCGEMYQLIMTRKDPLSLCDRESRCCSECVLNQVGQIAQIGFLDCAGFDAESQGVWVCGYADGGNLKELLLQIFSAVRSFLSSVFPAEGNEADGDRVKKFSFIESVGDPSHWVGVDGKMDALEKLAATYFS